MESLFIRKSIHLRKSVSSRIYLCLASGFVCTWEPLHVLLDASLVPEELNVGTIHQHPAFLFQLDVFISFQWRETPILANDDLLATWELVHGSSESFDSSSTVRVPCSYGKQDLANVNTSDSSIRLSPRTTHSGLQSIGTSAGQHLIDPDDMIGMSANTEMETFFASNFDQVSAEKQRSASSTINRQRYHSVSENRVDSLVGANTSGFQGFRAQLFILV